jgi:hypothetical protein
MILTPTKYDTQYVVLRVDSTEKPPNPSVVL